MLVPRYIIILFSLICVIASAGQESGGKDIALASAAQDHGGNNVALASVDQVHTGADSAIERAKGASACACSGKIDYRDYNRESTTMIGVGQTTQWDTYLSNERYHGPSFTILSQKSRPTHWLDRRLYVQHLTFGNFSYAKPRSGKHKTLSGFFHWQVAWHYHFLKDNHSVAGNSNIVQSNPNDVQDNSNDAQPNCESLDARPFVRSGSSSAWELNAGVGLQVNTGFVYNTLGGNNPASGRMSLHLLGSGQARYHFRWGKQRFTGSFQADIPLAGLFFSPDYGQSYYEIFSLGHYHHNICFANPLRAFQANILLSLDWHLKPTTSLRLGYSGQFMQSHANGLKTQDLSNYFIIGYVRRF